MKERMPNTQRLMIESAMIEPSPITAWSMLAVVELRGRQIAVLGVDWRGGVEEIERRQRLRECEVRLEEGPHRADVLPVALKIYAKSFFWPSKPGMISLPKSVIVLSSASAIALRLKT
jgi:hypothetical protein